MELTIEFTPTATDSIAELTQQAINACCGYLLACSGTDLVSITFNDNGTAVAVLRFLTKD